MPALRRVWARPMTTDKLIYLAVGIVLGLLAPRLIGWILDRAEALDEDFRPRFPPEGPR